jgi:hypothetical protein
MEPIRRLRIVPRCEAGPPAPVPDLHLKRRSNCNGLVFCCDAGVRKWPEAMQNDVRSHVGFQGLKRNVSNATDQALVTRSSPSYNHQFA